MSYFKDLFDNIRDDLFNKELLRREYVAERNTNKLEIISYLKELDENTNNGIHVFMRDYDVLSNPRTTEKYLNSLESPYFGTPLKDYEKNYSLWKYLNKVDGLYEVKVQFNKHEELIIQIEPEQNILINIQIDTHNYHLGFDYFPAFYFKRIHGTLTVSCISEVLPLFHQKKYDEIRKFYSHGLILKTEQK
jgi:hypothetical protein